MKTALPAPAHSRRWPILAAAVLVSLGQPTSNAQTITLDSYLDLIRTKHPFFVQEALSFDIALKQQERFLGEKNWEASIRPSYTHNDTADIGFGTVDQFDNTRVAAGIGREVESGVSPPGIRRSRLGARNFLWHVEIAAPIIRPPICMNCRHRTP